MVAAARWAAVQWQPALDSRVSDFFKLRHPEPFLGGNAVGRKTSF
jgi:hypothetical protein